METISAYQKELTNACQTFDVEELYVFGSILTDRFNGQSDIDFIVHIGSKDPMEYAENYFNLKFELEKLFNRKIDLLEQKSIKNKAFENFINGQKILVYAKRDHSLA